MKSTDIHAGPCDVGVIGLGVMGRNLAYNLAFKGYRTAAFDVKREAVNAAIAGANGLYVTGCRSIEELADSLSRPRKAIILVTAGAAVDSVIDALARVFGKDDIIIDCGNSYYKDTIRREKSLKELGIYFLGTGISGGEEGALHGPSIMAGGGDSAWRQVSQMLCDVSATEQGEPCCGHMGPDGAGHFVKMVHNGIEYADMQLIAESYFIMRQMLAMKADEIADVFEDWNKGELNSYLIEITVKVLRKLDENGKPLVDAILDRAGQKGTGVWTSQEALSLGVPAPSMAEAVFARALSAAKDERMAASRLLAGECEDADTDKEQWIPLIGKALYTFKICTYAQGFDLLYTASRVYNWNMNLGEIAKIWRGGCIIRAQFLNHITSLYEKNPDVRNLIFDEYFKDSVAAGLPACRRIVAAAAMSGVPLPCFSATLSYYDGLRSPFLPANLIQAQRDFFGAHTYERADKPGVFHTQWE